MRHPSAVVLPMKPSAPRARSSRPPGRPADQWLLELEAELESATNGMAPELLVRIAFIDGRVSFHPREPDFEPVLHLFGPQSGKHELLVGKALPKGLAYRLTARLLWTASAALVTANSPPEWGVNSPRPIRPVLLQYPPLLQCAADLKFAGAESWDGLLVGRAFGYLGSMRTLRSQSPKVLMRQFTGGDPDSGCSLRLAAVSLLRNVFAELRASTA